MESQTVFDTKPLLRPSQVEEAKSEIAASEAKLLSPHIEDKGEVSRQLRRIRKTFEEQAPRAPVNGEEEGRMVKRSGELLNDILTGMPSQEEMRKAPPGAVDKHMKWEKDNKIKIQEWKNLQLRLKPGEPEAANLERHRPVDSSLNMDNARISGKFFFMPPNAGSTVTFSDEQLATIRALDPATADKIGFMSNAQRAEVKEIIQNESLDLSEADKKRASGGRNLTKEQHAKRKRSYVMTPVQKQAAVKRMAHARASRKNVEVKSAEGG